MAGGGGGIETGRVTDALAVSRWSVVLETPDAARLAAFYRTLLGWEYRSRNDGWITVIAPAGGSYLAFNTSPEYVPPVWPPRDGEQQMMLHLDFCVGGSPSDLADAVATALGLGAREAAFQPQDDVRVMLDPDGHPFCLYVDVGP